MRFKDCPSCGVRLDESAKETIERLKAENEKLRACEQRIFEMAREDQDYSVEITDACWVYKSLEEVLAALDKEEHEAEKGK